MDIIKTIFNLSPDDEVKSYQVDEDIYEWREKEYHDEWYHHLIKATKLAIEELPPKQKIYVKKYYYENLTLEEIAEIDHCSSTNVCRQLIAAEKRLRNILRFAHPNLIDLPIEFPTPVKHDNKQDSYTLHYEDDE